MEGGVASTKTGKRCLTWKVKRYQRVLELWGAKK